MPPLPGTWVGSPIPHPSSWRCLAWRLEVAVTLWQVITELDLPGTGLGTRLVGDSSNGCHLSQPLRPAGHPSRVTVWQAGRVPRWVVKTASSGDRGSHRNHVCPNQTSWKRYTSVSRPQSSSLLFSCCSRLDKATSLTAGESNDKLFQVAIFGITPPRLSGGREPEESTRGLSTWA